MSKRDRRYQLPRNWIVLPLIVYTLIFCLTLGLISLVLDMFSMYTTSLKATNDIEITSKYADYYDKSSLEANDEFFSMLENQNGEILDTFIADSKLNIINSNCKVTAKLTKPDEDKPATKRILIPAISDDGNIGLDETMYVDTTKDNLIYYADAKCKLLTVDDNKISPNLRTIDLDTYRELAENKIIYCDYWIAYSVKDGSQIIGFKTHLPLTLNDFAYYILFLAITYLLATLIFIILVANVLRTHRNNRKMKKLIFRDHITGDRNWFWFAYTAKNILKRRRSNVQYAIVSLTFVRYRNYVLCHSVDAGERTLRDIWKTINTFLDKNEIVAHGFIANYPILIKANTADEANARLERIIKSLSILGGEHDFKFQAGVYMIDPKVRKNADIDLLYNNASSARATLEATAETGIAFFDNQLVDDERWIDKVTERQKDALEKEEFKVYYQPKYDPRTNELMGGEALIRWDSQDLGFVSPGKFIPIFEKSGFITKIDHYMLSHVARDQKKWIDEGRKCVPVSVNVSRAHFIETNLAEQIRDIVDREGAPHDLIEIELTESAFFDDTKQMLKTIKKLKSYGFLVSMDDFGSGYSSLNSLKDMPLDILKLDAGFFSGDKHNERADIVVSETLQLARKLNMTTVAEGVEDQSQVDFLAAEGCNMIQGYYYAKPMPREEYELRLAKTTPSAPQEQPQAEPQTEVQQPSEPEQPAQEEQPQQPETAAIPIPAEPETKVETAPEIATRLLTEKDAEAVSELIRTTISISNKKDYPQEVIDQFIETETPEHVLQRASWTHFYVVESGDKIVGCGAIGPFWGKEDESSLFTIFVDPDYQGKGIGKLIINALENDEFFLRAKRIEIPASITGVPFYLKMGYNYKNGITEPDEEHIIRMEKFRE